MAEPRPTTTAPAADGAAAPALPLVVVDRTAGALVPRRPNIVARIARRVWFVPLLMALMMFGAFVGLYFQPPGLQFLMRTLNLEPGAGTRTPIAVPAPRDTPPPAPAAGPRFVVGLGKVLPEGEVITVAMPFGAGDARVASIAVKEGDRVEQGAVLAVLDNERQLRSAVDLARSTIAAREATLAQVRASVQASREEARAALARAETSAANAAREFERVEQLRQRGFAADQAYDQRRTARDESQREIERARAVLSRYGTGDIDRQPDVVVAARNLDAARAEFERASVDLERSVVRAPQTSTVLSIAARPGERPGNAGLMNLGDIEKMTVEVEIYQARIGLVAVGSAVEVTAEAFPRALRGSVTRIGLEVGRQTLVDLNPAANTDARVVKVTVALDAESAASPGASRTCR